MKRIKTFKLFESNENIDEVISVVKDMLMELDFENIETECGKYFYDKKNIYLTVSKPLLKNDDTFTLGDKSFTYDTIRDVIDNIIDYLESEGFVINDSSSSKMLPNGDFKLVITSSDSGPVCYLGLVFNPVR